MGVGTAAAMTGRSAEIRPVSALQLPGAASSIKKQRILLPDGAGGTAPPSEEVQDEGDLDPDADDNEEEVEDDDETEFEDARGATEADSGDRDEERGQSAHQVWGIFG